ncbi:MAG: hypothetical protein OEX06_06095, partial [Candidatus Bathyarchaeota archaeon]|nr:hypothetical protein [Candidatus Bathyarchaeota archaeon]
AKDITGQVFRIIGGTVWLLESWRSFDKITKQSRWTPEELGPKVKELLNRAPERENLQIIIKDLGIF